MKTEIRPEKSEITVATPSAGVRLLCAALLIIPVLLGLFLAIQLQ